MEIRVLKYFLMVAREENITKAANLLHITQAYSFQTAYTAGRGAGNNSVSQEQNIVWSLQKMECC